MKKTKQIKSIQKPYFFEGAWWLPCKTCNQPIKVSDKTIISIKCWKCTQAAAVAILSEAERDKLFGKEKSSSNRPAGWHFMKEFVDKDGTVYHKGKEVPELKGTLPPTKVKKKRKKKKKVKPIEKSFDKLTEKEIMDLAKVYKKKQKNKKK